MVIETALSDNKYRRWYFQICERARARRVSGYAERHHVVPRALGGSDDSCVQLTYREHFLAHWLLTKFTGGEALKKMHFALWCMSRNKDGRRTVTSWQYERAKKAKRAASLGSKHRQETIAKMRIAQSGRSAETRAKMSAALRGHTFNLGSKRSAETRGKLAAASSNRSPEIRARVSAALTAYHAARRAA